MIVFIGKQIADAIKPIAKWLSIVGGVILAGILAIRKWNKGVVASDDLEEAGEAAQDHKEATDDLKDNRDRLHDLVDDELSKPTEDS
jgi:hypothetical protein